jgi:hypothetical protein
MRSAAWQPRVPRVPRCPKRSLLQQGQHRVHTRATGRLQRYQAVARHLAHPVQHQELPEDALRGCLPRQAECLPASCRVVSQTRPGSGCRRLTGQAGDPGGTAQRKNSNIRASTTIDHRVPPVSTIPRGHRSERDRRLHQSTKHATHTHKHKHTYSPSPITQSPGRTNQHVDAGAQDGSPGLRGRGGTRSRGGRQCTPHTSNTYGLLGKDMTRVVVRNDPGPRQGMPFK